MQNVLKNISVCLLAILVCVATISFTFSMHYCGSKMVSYSVIAKVKTCCEANSIQFSEQGNLSELGMSCCKDKKLDKESENELTFSIIKSKVEFSKWLLLLPQLITQDFVFANTCSFSSSKLAYNNRSLYCYSDTIALFQVFLI